MAMEEAGVGMGDALQLAREGNSIDGCGSGMWIFALLILLFGLGGNWGNRQGEAVTESALCNATNFGKLEDAVGRLSDQNAQQTAQLANGISSLGYDQLSRMSTLQQQISDCCCTTQRAIDGTNTALATDTAAINANTTAVGQKILDALCQSKTDALQAQVSQLQLQAALQGVMRYPMGTTYTAGYNPYFNQAACNCGTVF